LFGSFALISKQLFQCFYITETSKDHSKQTETKEKWPCPCPCPSPLHESFAEKTETEPKQIEFRFTSVCFETRIFCFGPFRNGFETETEKTETEPKQIEFQFVSVRTETKNCLFRGHPYTEHLSKQRAAVQTHCSCQDTDQLSRQR
jgi:hypothetical protein